MDFNLKVRTLPPVEWDEILSLSVSPDQIGYIESSEKCLDDARTNAYDMEWQFYGIYAQDTLIGFAMHGLGDAAYIDGTRLWLDRFMIDGRYQGKGYGKASLGLIMEQLYRDYHRSAIFLSLHDDNFPAMKLYEAMGFTHTHQRDPMGELIMVHRSDCQRLRAQPVSKLLENYSEIVAFMERVFPKEEQMPMWLLRLLSKLKGFSFNAYYEGDLFIGILFTIESKDTLFVFYLAVNDELHSKGYGSKLLEGLFDQYPDKSVTLFIETMDDTGAQNYDQRVKRLAFYQRNGFVHTGIKAGGKTPFVDLLSTDASFDMKKAKKLLRGIPMKLFPPN